MLLDQRINLSRSDEQDILVESAEKEWFDNNNIIKEKWNMIVAIIIGQLLLKLWKKTLS